MTRSNLSFASLLAPLLLLLAFTNLPFTAAHGDHDHDDTSSIEDWATRHLAEEHHISNMDPAAFFTLHDFDSNGLWEVDEIARTYGLEDHSTDHVSPEKRQEALNKVLSLFDPDNENGGEGIAIHQFVQGWSDGKRLPDFGFGPGHHGDDEYEYEIHHFEKYHGEDAREEDLTHPEDIAHFRKHDQEELTMMKQEQLDRMMIVEANIPAKFRKNM